MTRAHVHGEARQIVVMGPSGSGKSVVGELLATMLGLPFVDADDLHPPENIRKMSAGTPLGDEDRWPWLALTGREIARHDHEGVVVACSALRRSYRDRIRVEAPTTRFAELVVPRSVLHERLVSRPGHFMPATLLASQLSTLEPLTADERGARIETNETPAVIAEQIAVKFGLD